MNTNGEPEYWFEVGPDVQTNFGSKGQWVEHRVWITNTGMEPDVYLPMFHGNDWWTKFHTVDLRPQGIYNGIDDGSETWWWGPVQPGETKEYAIKVFVPTDEIGAFDHTWISITSDNDDAVVDWVEIWTRNSLPAPFYDDFEAAGDSGTFGLYNDGGPLGDIHGVWTRTDGTRAGVSDATHYSPTHSMFTRHGPVTITSAKINLDVPYAIASAVIQRGGGFPGSELPDGGEDLIVEYSDGNFEWTQWHELDTFYGGGMPGEIFTPYWILPENALTPRFQIRFRQTGGSGVDYDYWHIDDVYVGAPESAFDFFPGMTGVTQMSGPGYTATYDFFIENFADHGDEYMVQLSGGSWPAWANPGTVRAGPHGPMNTGFFNVHVDIPHDAVPGESDSLDVRVTSVTNPSLSEVITVTTTVGRVWNMDQNLWYWDIQPAINEADPGDEIYALSGTYNENIIVNKQLTIVGEDKETTIVEHSGSGAGVYFVTNTIADYGWGNGQDSRFFIENTFDWLWPVHANNGDILLVWDNTAWNNAWKGEMNSRAITWTERTGQTLTAADLNPATYPLVIISEYMNDGSMNNIESLVPSLENYVNNGGVLVDMIGSNNVRRWSRGVPGPFGTETVGNPDDNWNYVVEPTHPMVQNMNLPAFSGNSASHGRISVPPTGSTVLLTAGNVPGGVPVACWLKPASPSTVRITSNDVQFAGFTVQNAPIGILLDGASNCVIADNIVQNCGDGIIIKESGFNHIHDNIIRGMTAGAGVHIKDTVPGLEHSFFDDFSTNTGMWTYHGSASRTGGYAQVCPIGGGWGHVLFTEPIQTEFIIDFNWRIWDGGGADGLAFMFYKDMNYVPNTGSTLGFGDTPGYGIEFDQYIGVGDPGYRHIALIQNNAQNHLAIVADPVRSDAWRHAEIRVDPAAGTVQVFLDHSAIAAISWTGVLDTTFGGFGFTAATGGVHDNHRIDNVRIRYGDWMANHIYQNRIENNAVGVLLENGALDIIHHNEFIDNTLQAYDDSNAGLWDDGSEGNYWSDYTDRYPFAMPMGNIWNTAYDIDVGAQDRYPLLGDYQPTSDGGGTTPTDTEPEPTPTGSGGSGTVMSSAPEADPYKGAPLPTPEEATLPSPEPTVLPDEPDAEPAVEASIAVPAQSEPAPEEQPVSTETVQDVQAAPTFTGYLPAMALLATIALLACAVWHFRKKR